MGMEHSIGLQGQGLFTVCLHCPPCLEIQIAVLGIQDKLVFSPFDFKEKRNPTMKKPQFLTLYVFQIDILLQTDTCHGFQ